MRWYHTVIAVFNLLTVMDKHVDCRTKMHYVHWNTSSTLFRLDNTDHIIDVNRGNVPFEYDQVNIICPVYSPGTREEDIEKYIIYNVSKEEYESCRITNSNPRAIAVCDKPFKLMYFTITFRSFTPQPGGMEFHPGQDYYFISTSSSDDLHRRVAGRCRSHNMKIIFKICCKPEETLSKNSINSRRGMGIPSSVIPFTTPSISYVHRISTSPSSSHSPSTPLGYINFPAIKHNFEVPILGIRPTTRKSANFAGVNFQIINNEQLNGCISNVSVHQIGAVTLVSIMTFLIPLLFNR